jgi:glc operon protein GlcG
MKPLVLALGMLVLVATAAAAQAPVTGPLLDRKAISLEFAKKIAEAAEQKAAESNWAVAIAVVDEGGQLVYLARRDGTQFGSIEVAIRKATTAAAFKRPTKVFEDAVAGGRMALLGLPGAVPLEGGLPLWIEGKVVGAIGVSGATAPQDGMVAKAGVDACGCTPR